MVVGASAGGVEGLMALAHALPTDLQAAVLVVLHIPPEVKSVLPRLLNRANRLPAHHASDGQTILPGRMYIAPPAHHLLVRGNTIQLGLGPTENGHRPAVDSLFRTAARWHGPRVIGIVLSGSLDDGTAGLAAIKMAGGTTIVQDPKHALCPSMPKSALDHVQIDHVVELSDLGALVAQLVDEPTDPAIAFGGVSGVPSAFACPDCGGVLREIGGEQLLKLRCRVGHACLPEPVSAAKSEPVEEALWMAVRTLKESAALALRMAERAQRRAMPSAVDRYQQHATAAEQRASLIEELLHSTSSRSRGGHPTHE